MSNMVLHRGAQLVGRQDLMELEYPESTPTHTIIPHHRVVESVIECLSYRKIEVVKERYAVGKQGNHFFGLLTLSERTDDVALTLGIRNSHDKMFSLGMVAGFNVFICDNLALKGEFNALDRRHSAKIMDVFMDLIATGVDRTQRHFQPIREQIDVWKNHTLSDDRAKNIIYEAFIEGKLEAPQRLAESVHKNYFNPPHEEFSPRTLWSLHNAFTESFKDLEPMPQIRAMESLGEWIK